MVLEINCLVNVIPTAIEIPNIKNFPEDNVAFHKLDKKLALKYSDIGIFCPKKWTSGTIT